MSVPSLGMRRESAEVSQHIFVFNPIVHTQRRGCRRSFYSNSNFIVHRSGFHYNINTVLVSYLFYKCGSEAIPTKFVRQPCRVSSFFQLNLVVHTRSNKSFQRRVDSSSMDKLRFCPKCCLLTISYGAVDKMGSKKQYACNKR